jgi:hypothetical protein
MEIWMILMISGMFLGLVGGFILQFMLPKKN